MKNAIANDLNRCLLVIVISASIACVPRDPVNVNSSIRPDSLFHGSDPKPIGLHPVELRHSLDHEIHFLDVIGDSAMDTIVLKQKAGQTIIGMFIQGEVHDLFSVAPILTAMPEYITSGPPIERIYLEANSVQSADKCLRLVIRNTDTDLEYRFFDIILQNDEVRIGLCGMYDMGEMPISGSLGKVRICTAVYDRALEPDANGERKIIASDILGIFWGNPLDCQCQ